MTLLPKVAIMATLKTGDQFPYYVQIIFIFAKLVTMRLKKVLPSIIHDTQSYAIEKRGIHDNVHMMRDVISFANSTNCPLTMYH